LFGILLDELFIEFMFMFMFVFKFVLPVSELLVLTVLFMTIGPELALLEAITMFDMFVISNPILYALP
jgi:hypothetical protein